MLRYKEIKQMLLNEISQPNPLDRLPSRLEPCKKLDTTRTTLDKAIKELESEGIVFCRDGSGTYVAIPEGYDIKKPENWGIIVPDIMEDIYAGLVRGVEDFAQRNGVNLILCNFDHDPEKQEQYIRRLMLTGVSGIILVRVLCQYSTEVSNLYSVLADAKKPLVLCNMGVQGIEAPIVTSNNYYGGYLVTKHLIQRGYSPNHFHWYKTEDIINRGGGNVLIRVYNSNPDESVNYETDVTVHTDGRTYTVPAGTQIRLTPGESIHVQQYMYHDFEVEPGTGDVLLGEVSQCNDDNTDNRFNPPWGGSLPSRRMRHPTGCCVTSILLPSKRLCISNCVIRICR